MTAQDLVLILGAFSALFISALGFLSKVAIDVRRATTETNKAVNNRPDSQPTLRTLVEKIDSEMSLLREESFDRHRQNTDSIKRNSRNLEMMSGRISQVELDLRQHMADVDKGEK